MLQDTVGQKSALAFERLHQILKRQGVEAPVRGRGLIQGVEFAEPGLATRISQACFERGLIIETAGIDDQVLKLLPSLTITEKDLQHGLDTIETSLQAVLHQDMRKAA
jgi:diaminobutyrate-2-oxoglutarate transaminase